MITPYQKPEDKDAKANNFWTNLTAKLGLRAPLMRQASAEEQKVSRISDGIQVHGAHALDPRGVVASGGLIRKVSDQDKTSSALLDRYAGVFQRAVAELGQSERVKAADRLSRIEADMAAFRDKLAGLGGDGAMADLAGEVSAKADAVSGACVQLRDKVDALSTGHAAAIENAFLVLSDAKTFLDKMKTTSGPGADAVAVETGMAASGPDDMELVDGGASEMPPAPKEEPQGHSPVAGYVPAFKKKAMEESYDDLRCIHTKMCLVESMLSALASELNVTEMLGPGPSMEAPGMNPPGMPPTDQVEGEQKPLEASLGGRFSKFAGSGDPGDAEPGNLIYKDLNKCRDCVWFESDWTHETYRDKCKHCVHASLGGNVDHWWPRAMQMVMWLPNWGAPEAKENSVRLSNSFSGTLGLGQTARRVSAAAWQIAKAIVDSVEHTAVALGTALIEQFNDPVIARSMPLIAHEVADQIERETGIEIGITATRIKEWGRKVADIKDTGVTATVDPNWASGVVVIACDQVEVGLMHLAKGEKRQIKDLRERLRNEKDPKKIKEYHDAIDALYQRVDSDKKRKEDSRQQRDDRKKKEQESLDKEPAKIPAATASFKGTLCLAGQPNAAVAAAQADTKSFKVAAVSNGANSFGLHGVIMVAEDGEAWEAAASKDNLTKQGEVLDLDRKDVSAALASKGFEIVKSLAPAPADVVAQVWGRQETAGRSL